MNAHLPEALRNGWDVLMLFTIPVGGGIPAGVLLAQSKAIAWPWMMVLYLISDLLLAVVFEPILLVFARLASRFEFVGRVGAAFRQAFEKSSANYKHVTGPFGLIMVAFGVDPMTGRAAALAAGHGFVAGWAIAITGDMIYFTVLMVCTLWLKSLVGDGTVVTVVILLLMMGVPPLVRRLRRLRW